MKTMYKAYEWNPQIEEVQVVKDTGKTVSYQYRSVMNSTIILINNERKETDWYKYCETKQEAKDWLLGKSKAARQETLEKLQRQDETITKILEVEV